MTANLLSRPEAGKSPFVIEFLMVLCAGIRYMAYRDDSGKWRDAYSRRELQEPVKILD